MTINSVNQLKQYTPYIDDLSNNHQPGIFQLIHAPLAIKNNISYLFNLEAKFDIEGTVDIVLRLQRAQFSFIYSFCTAISWINLILHAVRKSQIMVVGGQFFKLFTPVLGIVLTVLEGASECIAILRLNRLKKKISHHDDHFHLVRLQRAYFKVHPHELAKIKNHVASHYSNLNKKERIQKTEEICAKILIMKEGKLARRIRPEMAAKIRAQTPVILKQLQNPLPSIQNEGKAHAARLISEVHTQEKCHRTIRYLGMASLVFILAGLIASLGNVPLLVTIVLGGVSSALSLGRKYYISKLQISASGVL